MKGEINSMKKRVEEGSLSVERIRGGAKCVMADAGVQERWRWKRKGTGGPSGMASFAKAVVCLIVSLGGTTTGELLCSAEYRETHRNIFTLCPYPMFVFDPTECRMFSNAKIS